MLNTASVMCFVFGHEANVDPSCQTRTEPPPPALEGDVINTGLLGKSPELFLLLFSHKMWALRETYSYLSMCSLLCFIPGFSYPLPPATGTQWVRKKYCGSPFCTQFPRKNFPECSETTHLNKSWLFKQELRDELWFNFTFIFLEKKKPFIFSSHQSHCSLKQLFFCYTTTLLRLKI